MRLSLSKTAYIVFVFCAVAATPSSAQTFKSLFSFQGTNGANPGYVNLVQGSDGNLYGTTEVSSGTEGTVFKFATSASKPTTLHVFCTTGEPCLDGAKPVAGLTLASNGLFYGTTLDGGYYGVGALFQITTAGKFTHLYDFGGGMYGSYPESPPILAADGYLHGTASEGGSSKNDGLLYKISTAGKFASLLSFTGGNGIYPYAGLIQATNGTYYGTTAEVTSGNGTVFEVLPTGTMKTLHKFIGAPGGGFPLSGLVLASGTLYGTTTTGGANHKGGTVFSISAAGKFTTLYSFCAKSDCTDGAAPEGTLILGTDGNLYGTTYNGGMNTTACNGGCGTIFRITTAGKLTTLYNFCSQSGCVDGYYPQGGLVQATNGTFYGTTFYGGTSGSGGTVYSLSVGLGPFVKILPTSGTAGTTAMILGDNLTGATKVSFNGIDAAFRVVSSTEIEATVPMGATTGTVTVVTPESTLTSGAIFQVD